MGGGDDCRGRGDRWRRRDQKFLNSSKTLLRADGLSQLRSRLDSACQVQGHLFTLTLSGRKHPSANQERSALGPFPSITMMIRS